ncbi:MAG: thioesterase family protein [Thermoanaerobaculia bacterium]|nr:thioesterase family protein [Thermoanaerobaculia bacterium]
MRPATHLAIDPRFSGSPKFLGEGRAEVQLATLMEMAADAEGLVHGGFIFSLADHAAMLAVNDPLVVLSTATVEFLRPVAVGEVLVASAQISASEGRRSVVECQVQRGEETVFRGTFDCVVPRRHVLAPRPTATSDPGSGA